MYQGSGFFETVYIVYLHHYFLLLNVLEWSICLVGILKLIQNTHGFVIYVSGILTKFCTASAIQLFAKNWG